jgi:hypothetical protein
LIRSANKPCRDDQEERIECVKPEGIDDDGRESRDGTVGNHAEESDEEYEPEFQVCEEF